MQVNGTAALEAAAYAGGCEKSERDWIIKCIKRGIEIYFTLKR